MQRHPALRELVEGRDLPPEKELLEHIPVEMFDTAQHIASRGPFLVAKEVLPAMRKRGAGSFFFSNNASSLRGRKRMTGQSLYYPRVMMRTLAQVLTEEYSEHGVHVANVVIDGTIDSPGTRALPKIRQNADLAMNPVKIAEAFFYLHSQDRSCWTHELQLTIADLVAEVHDTHHPVAVDLYYEDQMKEARRKAADFLKNRVPKYLGYFEKILAGNSRGSKYLQGAKLSYADLSLFQIVAGLSYAFPNAMARTARKYRRLFALHARIQERPRIGAYLASPRRIAFNEDGIFRHYPELDAARKARKT